MWHVIMEETTQFDPTACSFKIMTVYSSGAVSAPPHSESQFGTQPTYVHCNANAYDVCVIKFTYLLLNINFYRTAWNADAV